MLSIFFNQPSVLLLEWPFYTECLGISLLRRLFTDQHFFLSSDCEVRVETHTLQTKAIEKAARPIREKSCLDAANITLKMSTSVLSRITKG